MTRTTTLVSILIVAMFASAEFVALSQEDENPIAATVEGEPIYVREVEREVAKVIRDRKVADGALRLLKAQALQQLVNRRLILRYLKRKELGASDEDLTLAIARVEEQLKTQNVTLEAYLDSTGLSDDDFRQAFVWQLSWQRYLDRYLTDSNLESYFNRHRRDFDGTQLHVAHILLKVSADAQQQAWQDAEAGAAAIRDEIVGSKLTFSQAAQQYSQSPTAGNGGDIRFIFRNKPMPESFSQAAFSLQKGEISQPVKTPFGVHLIHCVDVKPGEKDWRDSRRELKLAVTRYLFDWVAEHELTTEKVPFNFTGITPYFRPGTDEVVAE